MPRLGYSVSTTIAQSPQRVFAFLSDLRNELEWNPDAVSIEKLTDGPVGLGTRFRARWARTSPTIVELIRFEPPVRWTTRSRAMGMDVTAEGRLEPLGDRTRYSATIDVRPRGLARLLALFAVRMMRSQEARNMDRIRATLEEGPLPDRSA